MICSNSSAAGAQCLSQAMNASRNLRHSRHQGRIADWHTYRRLWVFIRPYLQPLSLVVIVSLGATALTLFQPYVSKLLIDRALMPRDMHALLWIAGLMFATSVLGFGFNILASYRYVKISAAMLFDIRLALFRHLQTLSPRFYARLPAWRPDVAPE